MEIRIRTESTHGMLSCKVLKDGKELCVVAANQQLIFQLERGTTYRLEWLTTTIQRQSQFVIKASVFPPHPCFKDFVFDRIYDEPCIDGGGFYFSL